MLSGGRRPSNWKPRRTAGCGMPADFTTLRRIAGKLHRDNERIVRLRREFATRIEALRSAPTEEVRHVC